MTSVLLRALLWHTQLSWQMEVALCIHHYPNERLRSHSARHVVGFFTEIGRDSNMADWQLRQTVDAIRILFGDLPHSESCAAITLDAE